MKQRSPASNAGLSSCAAVACAAGGERSLRLAAPGVRWSLHGVLAAIDALELAAVDERLVHDRAEGRGGGAVAGLLHGLADLRDGHDLVLEDLLEGVHKVHVVLGAAPAGDGAGAHVAAE